MSHMAQIRSRPSYPGTWCDSFDLPAQLARALPDFEESVQLADAGGVTHLAQGLGLDLADALAGDA